MSDRCPLGYLFHYSLIWIYSFCHLIFKFCRHNFVVCLLCLKGKIINFTPFPVQTPEANEFLDMVAGIQGSRMNDQRATLPQFPGLNSQAVINQFLRNRMDTTDVPDDSFFEMLMRCQVCLFRGQLYEPRCEKTGRRSI